MSDERTPDELFLLCSAETRIDTALSRLLLAAKGVTDTAQAQEAAAEELRKAREAIKVLRDRYEREDPDPAL